MCCVLSRRKSVSSSSYAYLSYYYYYLYYFFPMFLNRFQYLYRRLIRRHWPIECIFQIFRKNKNILYNDIVNTVTITCDCKEVVLRFSSFSENLSVEPRTIDTVTSVLKRRIQIRFFSVYIINVILHYLRLVVMIVLTRQYIMY